MKSCVTISLVPEAKGGPFVFWDNLERSAESARKLGFEAIEIFPRSAEQLDTDQLQRVLSNHALELAAIGTGAGWVVEKLRLTDPEASKRKEALRFVRQIVDVAGSMGAPAIIGSMQGRWEGNVSRDQALGWMADALSELGPQAARYGTVILLEPLNRYETNLFNRLGETADYLDSNRLWDVMILADLFHMNIEEPSMREALENVQEVLGHVHFADSNRWAPGFGHADLKEIVRTLKETVYEGYLSAEVFPRPDPETAAAQTMKTFRQLVEGN